MNVMKMKREDFANIPYVHLTPKLAEDSNIVSVVIIPANEMHDSGFRCMEFVAVDNDNKPMFKFGGGCDIIHIDGILGIGKVNLLKEPPQRIKPKWWRIDALPCGYLRIFCIGHRLITDSFVTSDFELFAERV